MFELLLHSLQAAATQAASEAIEEAKAAAEQKVADLKAVPRNAAADAKQSISSKTKGVQDSVAEARRKRDELKQSR